MNAVKLTSGFISVAMLVSGCASTSTSKCPAGSMGPKIVSSGQATETGQYAEVGVQFTSFGDFVALVNPTRWKSPVATGGSLSWLNPDAWSEDAGRTGRILLGEAVVIGGVAFAASSDGDDEGGDSGPTNPGGSGGGLPGGTTPPPPAP